MSSKKVKVGDKYYPPNTPLQTRRIVDIISSELDKLKDKFDIKMVKQLEQNFALENQPEIDYDKYGLTFDFQYLLTNYWKYYVYISNLKPQILLNNIKVADVGSGAGTFSLAYLSWLNSVLTEKITVDLLLVDRSKKQLDYAQRFYNLVKPKLNNICLKINFSNKDLLDFKFSKDSIDTFLLGHIFTTDQKIIPATFKNIFTGCKPLSDIHILERLDDNNVWKKIGKETSSLCLPVNKGFHQNTSKIPFRFGYMNIKMPDSKLGILLTQNYFNAWRNKSVSKLHSVFEKSAIYYEKPFQKPINSLKEIDIYWRQHVLKQRNIKIVVVKCIYFQNLALSEWSSEFDFENKHYKLSGILYLNINPSTKLASSLTEYFRSKKSILVAG